MARTGRPKVKIDWEQFDKLCYLQCTIAEIAHFFDCSHDTIERAVKREKKMTFASYYSIKKEGGRIAVRRKQYQIMESGNVAMAIWLGKQILGQRDKQEISGNESKPLTLAYASDGSPKK